MKRIKYFKQESPHGKKLKTAAGALKSMPGVGEMQSVSASRTFLPDKNAPTGFRSLRDRARRL